MVSNRPAATKQNDGLLAWKISLLPHHPLLQSLLCITTLVSLFPRFAYISYSSLLSFSLRFLLLMFFSSPVSSWLSLFFLSFPVLSSLIPLFFCPFSSSKGFYTFIQKSPLSPFKFVQVSGKLNQTSSSHSWRHSQIDLYTLLNFAHSFWDISRTLRWALNLLWD